MWGNDEVKNDFMKRIKNVNPNIVINLCTDSANNRREAVQQSIEEAFKDKKGINYFMGSHPSSWGRNKNNRYIYNQNNGNDKPEKIKF